VRFKATSVFNQVSIFHEKNAPDWLTCKDQVPNSAMDNSWFFRDHILKLEVGQSAETDFHIIERIA
jgi:hypothetical protein